MLLQITPPVVTNVAYCVSPQAVLELAFQIMGISFALMIAMLSLFWMASQFFRRAEYEGLVSIETHQLIVSAILLATVFGATIFSCQLSVAFAGDDPFVIGTSYLSHISNNIALKAVLSLEATKAFSQYWGSMSFRWGLTVWGVATPAFPSFIIIERVVDFILMLITPFVASLMVQQVILEVIKGTAVAFILPAGVVLRMFPPTRNAGSFLMATAIGFQILYPYTYVMHRQIVYELEKNAGLDTVMENLFNEENLDEGLWPWAVFSQGFFDIKTMLLHPVDALGFLLLQALFLPALSITLTVSFIKGLSKFMSQKLN
ncbi:MAG: hypothetical protein WCT52_00110 [Candidatus Micrarchaeia archaeon]